MMECILIRHGKTYGNTLGRYIGRTDEPLCEEGKAALKEIKIPQPELLFVSPMMRCRETAALLFPNQKQQVLQNLRECNFGDFENKNYKELANDMRYQQWIDSNGTLPFPNGESPEEFRERSFQGFLEALGQCREQSVRKTAFVVHGGTICSIMSRVCEPLGDFYHWQVKNAEGYRILLEDLQDKCVKGTVLERIKICGV